MDWSIGSVFLTSSKYCGDEVARSCENERWWFVDAFDGAEKEDGRGVRGELVEVAGFGKKLNCPRAGVGGVDGILLRSEPVGRRPEARRTLCEAWKRR
jgi:hypothetical protein